MAIVVVRFDFTTRRIALGLMEGLACPLCAMVGKVEMSVYRQYMSVLGWLPVAPTGQFGAAYCHQCRRPIPRKSNDAGLRAAFAAMAANAPRPRLRYYSGVIVTTLIALAGFATFAAGTLHQREGREAKAQMQGWMADPQPGDIEVGYLPDASTSHYTLLNVVSVTPDAVTFRAYREPLHERPESLPSAALSLSDRDFSGATFAVPKSDIRVSQYRPPHRIIPETPLGMIEIEEALRRSKR